MPEAKACPVLRAAAAAVEEAARRLHMHPQHRCDRFHHVGPTQCKTRSQGKSMMRALGIRPLMCQAARALRRPHCRCAPTYLVVERAWLGAIDFIDETQRRKMRGRGKHAVRKTYVGKWGNKPEYELMSSKYTDDAIANHLLRQARRCDNIADNIRNLARYDDGSGLHLKSIARMRVLDQCRST